MKYIMKYLVNFIFIFSLFLASCNQPVSLGSRLSMAGPLVNIVKPAPDLTVDETDPAVRTVFNVSGTVTDDVKITSMTVTLDYWNAEADVLTRMGREWKWEKQWMIRESEEEEWQPYTEASYNPVDADPRIPASPPLWSVNKNTVNWNLPVTMNRMEQGEYFITVSAWNSAGRHDSQSAAKLKIKYNNFSPTVRIINPLLLAGSGSLSFPRPPSWDEYTFDPFNLPEETSMNLMYYTNSFNDLSYRLEYTISPPTAFSFEITNEHDLDNFLDNSTGEKAAYYRWKWEGEEFPPQMGIFTDRAASGEDTYARAGGRIELSDTVKNSLPRATVTPMQLVTRVKDATGLEEYKSKGWFLYLPDSDKPYPFIDFAHRVHKDSSPPADAAELVTMLRGSTNYNNLAYDDDGLKELKWTVYKLKDDSLETERTAGTGTVAFEGNKKEPWPFQAHRSFGTGRFKVTISVQDINGTWGDEYHGYFTIFSNTTPTVVTPMDSPAILTTTFWGDANGNITIAGKAQIEDYDECDGLAHGVRVNEVIITWIKPNLGTENNFRYLDANDPLWDAATNGAADSYGNKTWKPGLSFVAATAGNNNPNAQEEWEFSQMINYFNDLKIGFNKMNEEILFTDQQFRIRVLSQGGVNVLPRSSVYAFTTRGDVTAPVVEITHIVINDDEYDLSAYGVTLPVIAQGDEVKLKGTYSDDSIGQWSASANRHNEYLTDFTVSWAGEERKFDFLDYGAITYTLDNPSGGNWETAVYTFNAHNRDPIIQLTAGLTDIGGRRGTANEVLVVETLEPVLVRISSEAGNGYYSEHKQTDPPGPNADPNSRYIDIYLEFNKPVSFMYDGGPATLDYSNAPHLTLNNGGEAFYLPPGPNLEGVIEEFQNKITFRYFVDGVVYPSLGTAQPNHGGTSSPAVIGSPGEWQNLNVTAIVFGSFFTEPQWKGKSGIAAVLRDEFNVIKTLDPTYDYSLANQKKIIIDKTAPTIAAVTTPATANRYGVGSEINIEVKFTESVVLTGTPSMFNTYLTLTGGNLPGNNARAGYQNVKDSTSINFVYTVLAGHDTSDPTPIPLGVSAMTLVTGAVITDVAGNPATLTIPAATTFAGRIIDTVPPAAPSIGGNVAPNASYYGAGGTTFTVSGIVSGNTVEYNFNYPAAAGWTPYNGGAAVTGTTTNPIALDINGVYQIAARQWDTAIPPNCSLPSAVVQPVRIDSGGILQRITSSLADGYYSADAADTSKRTVTVDLEFRIPVTLASESGGTITLNTTGGANTATLLNSPTGKKWTFNYPIPTGAHTNGQYLDVIALNLDSLTINDQYGTRVNGPNGWLTINDITSDRKLINQKKIKILEGRPRVLTPPTGVIRATPATTDNITFNGTQLRLTFDRDIYRGLTSESLIIRQIWGGNSLSSGSDQYKIPAALTETQWNETFLYNETLTGVTAANWEALGRALYERGSNGATLEGNNLISDTSVKWVLKFAINPDDDTLPSGMTLPSGLTTMQQIRTAFRQAETLRFTANDQRINIENGNVLTVDLSTTGHPLPVKGARYEWVFPNGFIRDILGTANGTGTINDNLPSGTDTNLTTSVTTTPSNAETPRILFYNNATDPPVIRIDKSGGTQTFTTTDDYRQLKQPVMTQVRINSRTPNAEIRYWTRQTTDNVPALLSSYDVFPIITPEELSLSSTYIHTRLRPQSGTAGYTPPSGVNQTAWTNTGPQIWAPIGAWPAGNGNAYSGPFDIGNGNYADGGMMIHIRAQATATGVTENPSQINYGYEAAFRSVFVYINQTYKAGNFDMLYGEAAGANMHRLQGSDTQFTSNRDRVWIRGSNNLAGDTTVPDFPLSRDQTKSRKAGLLTPMLTYYDTTIQTITWMGAPKDPIAPAANIYAGRTFTHDTIFKPSDYGGAVSPDYEEGRLGRHLWFWVTWGLNVPAYIDIFYGELPSSAGAQYQVPSGDKLRYLIGGATGFKEHYAVHPGRTTIYNADEIVLWNPITGIVNGSDYHRVGPAVSPPPPQDQ